MGNWVVGADSGGRGECGSLRQCPPMLAGEGDEELQLVGFGTAGVRRRESDPTPDVGPAVGWKSGHRRRSALDVGTMDEPKAATDPLVEDVEPANVRPPRLLQSTDVQSGRKQAVVEPEPVEREPTQDRVEAFEQAPRQASRPGDRATDPQVDRVGM